MGLMKPGAGGRNKKASQRNPGKDLRLPLVQKTVRKREKRQESWKPYRQIFGKNPLSQAGMRKKN